MDDNTEIKEKETNDYRFWVETLFLFVVLVFCMVQLARDSAEQPVYFTIISGICGKITKLKIKKTKRSGDASSGSGGFFLDEVDGHGPRRYSAHPTNSNRGVEV